MMVKMRGSVLITGGSRGLGRAIGDRLAHEGYAIGLLGRTDSTVEEAANAINNAGGHAVGLVADVLDPAALARAVERFAGRAGGCDALVCSAGTLRAIGPAESIDATAWWRDLETPVRGFHHAVCACLPYLRVSQSPSISVLVGPGTNGALAFASSYGAAQAALARLVESLAEELSRDQIPVYAVNPGLVATDLVRHVLDYPEGRRWLPRFTEAFAEGKEVGSEVVAEMMSWLVSHRPSELAGRVVAAPMPPAIQETRLARIVDENLNVLRLR